MKVRVYLATTRGPVQIVRITPERAEQSVVCLQNTSTVLQPLSAHYHDFVRQPSGVIMRELGPFGGTAFRLDVSNEVGQGDSWQLAVFVAHALAAKGCLAAPHEDCDAAVWLTGEVGNDLNIGAVTHISDKLKASRAEFDELTGDKIPFTIVLPEPNRGEGTDGAGSGKVVFVGTAHEAVEIAGAATPGTAARNANERIQAPPRLGRAAGKRRIARIVVGAIVVLAAVAAAGYAGSQFWFGHNGGQRIVDSGDLNRIEREPEPPVVVPPVVSVIVSGRQPPPGKTCAAVLFGSAEAVLTPLVRGPSATVETAMRDDLCGLDFAVIASGGMIFAAAELRRISGKLSGGTSIPPALFGAEPLSDRTAWHADLPRQSGAVEYDLVVVSAGEPVSDVIGWLFSQTDRAQAERELAQRGIKVISINHRVTPR